MRDKLLNQGSKNQAIILLKIRPEKEADILKTLQSFSQIKEVYAVSGLYDKIIFVETECATDGRSIYNKIQALPSINCTIRLLVN